jgi:hypothetical protein
VWRLASAATPSNHNPTPTLAHCFVAAPVNASGADGAEGVIEVGGALGGGFDGEGMGRVVAAVLDGGALPVVDGVDVVDGAVEVVVGAAVVELVVGGGEVVVVVVVAGTASSAKVTVAVAPETSSTRWGVGSRRYPGGAVVSLTR